MTRALASIPALLGGLAVAILAVMLLVQGLGVDLDLSRLPAFQPLAGVTEPELPIASWSGLADGQVQRAVSRGIGARVPVFPAAVRLHNEIVWRLFGQPTAPSMLTGRHRELLDRDYIHQYCTRDIAGFAPFATRWAQDIRAMQDEAERRGKTFLYVVTPSKIAAYPGFLPDGLHCAASPAQRDGLVPYWIGLVRAAGVHVVDTVSIVADLRGRYPFDAFPLGGIHWNGLAAALASASVSAALDQQRQDGQFAPLEYAFTMAVPQTGSDADLARLLNLFHVPKQYLQPTPLVALGAGPASRRCTARAIVVVGGSFSQDISHYLTSGPCPVRLDNYEYWHAAHLVWRGGEASKSPVVDPAERDHAIQAADIIIYEHNEPALSTAMHGGALYQYLTGQRIDPLSRDRKQGDDGF